MSGPPSAHLHPHELPSTLEFSHTQQAAYEPIEIADSLRVATIQRDVKRGRASIDWTRNDGVQALLDTSEAIALVPESAREDSPLRAGDEALLSYMQSTVRNASLEAEVDWDRIGQRTSYATIVDLYDDLSKQYSKADGEGDTRLKEELANKRSKLGAWLMQDGGAPNLDAELPYPNAAEEFAATYTRHESNPEHSSIADAKARLQHNEEVMQIRNDAYTVLLREGYGSKPPVVGDEQIEPIIDIQNAVSAELGRLYESSAPEREHHQHRHDALQSSINKLAKRNGNLPRKIGSHALDIVRIIRRKGTLKQQFKHALRDQAASAHSNEDRQHLYKEAHKSLIDTTNKHAQYFLDHGLSSILLKGNLTSKAARGTIALFGGVALASLFVGTGGLAGVAGLAVLGSTLLDKSAHKKVRGKMEANPNLTYNGGLDAVYKSISKDYGGELLQEFGIRILIGGYAVAGAKVGDATIKTAKKLKEKVTGGGGGHH